MIFCSVSARGVIVDVLGVRPVVDLMGFPLTLEADVRVGRGSTVLPVKVVPSVFPLPSEDAAGGSAGSVDREGSSFDGTVPEASCDPWSCL